jgi:Arc/MetJ-type ribon-helix-helix transcriptional regulator
MGRRRGARRARWTLCAPGESTQKTAAAGRGKDADAVGLRIPDARLRRSFPEKNQFSFAVLPELGLCVSVYSTRDPQPGNSTTAMPPTAQESSPLTFDLKEELLSKIEAARSANGFSTNSETIRHAIESFDFPAYQAPVRAHRQISVRLRVDTKKRLVKLAKKHDVSVGELLRTAIENLPRGKKSGKK